MQDIISAVVLVAMLISGTIAADKIYHSVREAALKKAAQGLPKLEPLAGVLTQRERNKKSK